MTWQGDPRTSTAAWRRTRNAVLKRDAHRCRIRIPGICTGTATEVHHTVAGNDDPHLLLSACHACHAQLTAADGVAARSRLAALRRRPTDQHPGFRQGGGG